MRARNAWTAGGLTLILVILASTILFGLVPTYISIKEINSQTELTSHQNLFREHYLTILKNRAKNKDHFYVFINAQRNQLPDQLQVVEFLNQMDGLSRRSGVQVSNLSVNLPQAFAIPASVTNSSTFAASSAALAGNNKVKGATVSLSVVGDVSHIRAFLAALEGNTRYVLVSSVTMQPVDSSATSKGNLRADISGMIFTYGN